MRLYNILNDDTSASLNALTTNLTIVKKEQPFIAGLDRQWIYIVQLETSPPSTSSLPLSSPDPSTATAQREGDSLISALGLNINAFLGNLHSSGKEQ